MNQSHYFEACVLTDRFSHDESQAEALLKQIDDDIDHFSADGAYDETPIYNAITDHSPDVDVVIPPRSNAVLNKKATAMRNRNIQEIKAYGRMAWQKIRQYGRRNLSALGVQRYQRILGYMMHARRIERQKKEAMIGCGVINEITSLGMPVSYRSA